MLALVAVISFTGCSGSSGSSNSGSDDTSTDAALILVTNSDDNTLSVIDSSSQTVEATVTLSGTYPWEIALCG
ncbi:MAG: hypothetical protein R2864_07710 [Syntrophotaleaceae bacterium]